MTQADAIKERCKGCERELDVCACCQEPGCPKAICYGCQAQELRHTIKQPHAHGG